MNEILFDTVDDISASVIRDEIEHTIIKYEPRVKLEDVKVKPDYDNNQFDVTITYDIIGIDALTSTIKLCTTANKINGIS